MTDLANLTDPVTKLAAALRGTSVAALAEDPAQAREIGGVLRRAIDNPGNGLTAQRRARDSIAEAQRLLADGFARRHGMVVACRDHWSPGALARGPGFNGRNPSRWTREVCDHPYFMRYGGAQGKRAAVAAHLYGTRNADQIRETCRRFADAHNLIVSFPTEWPSWYYPDTTVLVVYQPTFSAKELP